MTNKTTYPTNCYYCNRFLFSDDQHRFNGEVSCESCKTRIPLEMDLFQAKLALYDVMNHLGLLDPEDRKPSEPMVRIPF